MIFIIAAVLLWGGLHSLLASLQVKRFLRDVVGVRNMQFYRLLYNLFSFLSFVPVLLIAGLTPDQTVYLVPFPWSVVTILGQTFAVVILIIGFLQNDPWEFLGLRQVIRLNQGSPAMDNENNPSGQFNTKGLYRFVRHPLYSAGLVFIWLMPVMTKNVLVINLGLTAYVIIGAILEERKLLLEFGQKYSDYSAITPMFIPFIFRNKRNKNSSS